MPGVNLRRYLPLHVLPPSPPLDVQFKTCTYGNGATLLFFKVLGLAYGQSRDNQNVFGAMGYHLSYGAAFARLRRAGAPLSNTENTVEKTTRSGVFFFYEL